jgi:hypothetical protein
MGRSVKNPEIELGVISATTILANNSPVLTQDNSTFDNVLYVAKNGNDSNDGRSLATPKLTIKAACQVATSRTAIKVASGVYTEDMPFEVPTNVAILGDTVRSVFVQPAIAANDMFYMRGGSYIWGITVQNYLGAAFSFPPGGISEPVTVSPYLQNITSFTTTGTTVLIDANKTLNVISTRAFILGFITSINRGGYGLVMQNRAYSQAVNIYTIGNDVGIKVESGSFLTLNGSDNGIGNYGMWADGIDQQFTGNVLGNIAVGATTCNIAQVSSPPRTNNGILFQNDPNMYFITTFSNVTGDYGGTHGNVWNVNISSRFSTNTGNIITNSTPTIGYQVSTISASAHTFEYVGAGTDPATALPQFGGIPIPENEVRETNYGRVNFTSTDHKGDFRIGPGLSVVRATGTIEGDDFNRSLFAVMTPYILSIEG